MSKKNKIKRAQVDAIAELLRRLGERFDNYPAMRGSAIEDREAYHHWVMNVADKYCVELQSSLTAVVDDPILSAAKNLLGGGWVASEDGSEIAANSGDWAELEDAVKAAA